MTDRIEDGGFAQVTARDLFAATAPNEVPFDFMPEPAVPRHLPGYKAGMSIAECDDLARNFRVNRRVAWRWYWADLMLAARKGGAA